MRMKIGAFLFGSALIAAAVVPLFGSPDVAFANVHVVAQAFCAATGAPSGAFNSSPNSPAAPIPVTASATGDVSSGGESIQIFGGGNLDGASFDCDAPGDVAQNP